MNSLNTHIYDKHINATESNNFNIVEKNTYSEEKAKEFKKWLDIEKDSIKKEQNDKISKLMGELNADKDQEIFDTLQKDGIEPITWINQIITFKELISVLETSTDNVEIKNSLKTGNYKDQRIYELPKYKELLEKWFILPSDKRNYYESAKWQDVFHLWVDYQVKEWTGINAIYDWEVVSAGPDWWLGHQVTIKHTSPDWKEFYSLYGHLSWEWLSKKWDIIKKWDKLGKVWKSFSEENWNWPSHLHFQIMKEEGSKKWFSSQEWEWQYDVIKALKK